MAQVPVAIRKCALCSTKNGSVYCYECDQALCETCRTLHDKIPVTKTHILTDLDKVNSIISRSNIQCEDHQHKYAFFCTKCECLICQQCVLSCHKDHTYSGIDEIAIKTRENLKKVLSDSKTKSDDVERTLNAMKTQHVKKIEDDVKNKKLEIQAATANIHSIIDSVKDIWIAGAEEEQQLETKEFQVTLENVAALQQEYKDARTKIEHILDESHNAAFLDSYENNKNIVGKLEKISIDKPSGDIEEFDFENFFDDIIAKTDEKFSGNKLPEKRKRKKDKNSSQSTGTIHVQLERSKGKSQLGFGIWEDSDGNTYVSSVNESGPAFIAGIRKGDKILRINGVNGTSHEDVTKLLLCRDVTTFDITLSRSKH